MYFYLIPDIGLNESEYSFNVSFTSLTDQCTHTKKWQEEVLYIIVLLPFLLRLLRLK